ncbi:MAG: HAD-IA family hydrolase, partial [Polymorphobacter sp.]
MQFKAVLWDFGGVITSSPFDAFNAYERERSLPENLIRRINAADPDSNAWARFERNEIGGAEFDILFAAEAARAGFDVRGADVIALLS